MSYKEAITDYEIKLADIVKEKRALYDKSPMDNEAFNEACVNLACILNLRYAREKRDAILDILSDANKGDGTTTLSDEAVKKNRIELWEKMKILEKELTICKRRDLVPQNMLP